jgi:hypothetical protein
MEEDKKQEIFTVKDKRRFVADESGSVIPESKTKTSGKEEPSEPAFQKECPEDEAKKAEIHKEDHIPMPEIDFSTFILSLSSSALLHLGLIENPHTRRIDRNLELAKQTIDILGMIRDKTKGNLSHDEDNLIENLLTDLRLKYVNEIGRK